MEDSRDASGAEGGGSTFEQLLEFVPDAIVGVGRTGRIVLVNRKAEDLFDYGRETLVGQSPEMLVPERFRRIHADQRADYFEQPHSRPMGTGITLFAVRRDGTEFPVEVSLSHLELNGETIAAAAVRDISEQVEREHEKTRQEQRQRARRLESIRQLAGGIAHDFSNLLGVIMNYAEFVADELEPGSTAHKDVEEIRRATERATALTRQLLVFGHREAAHPEVIDLAELIGELGSTLQRALGNRVEMTVSLGEALGSIEADTRQIEHAIVNLSLNARDAMPRGGRFLIEAENAELDDEYAYMHPGIKPGSYVRLKLSDTGVGMDRETLDRAFEPFYTTKSDAAGLGLALAQSIVTGAGGQIDVYSEPRFGTTVKIHLPAAGSARVALGEPPSGEGESVLVVEDEPDVRGMAERILFKNGYSVIGANSGLEAIAICQRSTQPIDVLLTDTIMPEMLASELVEEARSTQPALRVIYMSGHSHDLLASQALTDNDLSAFVEKPFNARVLLGAVSELLARPAHTTG